MAKVDLTKISYSVIAVLSTGAQVNLEGVAENIAWEENEKELSVRANLTLRDVPYDGGRLSAVLSLCTVMYIYYDAGDGRKEAFRGTVWEWEHSQIHDDEIVLTCYDMLYYLQKSTDSKYYEKGKSTSAICSDILSSWGVTMGTFSGPSITHEKTLYKNKTISTMLSETIDTARKQSSTKGVIRAREGKCEIVKQGANEDIWAFSADTNLVAAKDRYSMTGLVTRVVVVGKDDKQGRPKVEATLNGKTEYGILQQVKSRGSTKLADAKKEAQELLDEKGTPERTITLQSPDAPWIRKGDRIHVTTDNVNGYFYVKSISHNATAMMMQMEVEPT